MNNKCAFSAFSIVNNFTAVHGMDNVKIKLRIKLSNIRLFGSCN